MKKLLLAITLTVVPSFAQELAQAAQVVPWIYGAGAQRCLQWNTGSDGMRMLYLSWVQGFISASPYGIKHTDTDTVSTAVTGFCREHPDYLIADAAHAMVVFLGGH
jgi:hypothetical protein